MMRLLSLTFAGWFLLGDSSASAQVTDTFTGGTAYTGGTGGSWDTPYAWSLDALPQGAENVQISTGSSATLTLESTYTGTTVLNYNYNEADEAPPPQLFIDGNAGALSDTSYVFVGSGSMLTLGDTATTVADPDRLNNAASIELQDGQFNLISSSYAGTTAQQAGQLILDQGVSQFTLQQANTSAETELDLASVTQESGAVLWVTGTNLGQAAGTANSSRMNFGAVPTLLGGGGAAGTTYRSIVPYVVVSNTGDEGPSGLATYDPVNGLTPLNPATEYASNIATANPTDNVRITATSTTLTSGTTVNSLTLVYNALSASTLNLSGNTLNVTSGVLLDATPDNSGYSAIRPTIQDGTVNFGAKEGYIYGVNVAANITGTGGLTVVGAALTGTNSYSGVTYGDGGGITVGSNSALGATGPGNGTVLENSTLSLNYGVSIAEDLTFVNENTGDEGLYLSGNNQVSGNLTLSARSVSIAEEGNSTVSGNITSSTTGRTDLEIALSGKNTFSGNITDGTGTLSVDAYESGTAIFSGNNTFSGGLTFELLASGIITNPNSLGSGFVNFSNDLTLDYSSNATVANQLGGTGTLVLSGTGTVVVTSTKNIGWSGGAIIQGGALQIGDGGADGSSGTGTITNNSSLIFNSSSSQTVINVITGNGTLYQDGTGTVSLTGSNTFASTMIINQGAVSISAVAALGSAQPLGESSAVVFTGASFAAPAVLIYLGGTANLHQILMVNSHDYGLVDNAGSGVLTLSGTISKSGSVMTLAGGRIVVSGTIAGSSAGSDLVLGSTQYGSTTVGLTTANFYNGPTVITNGSTLLTGVTGALPSATSSAIILGASTDAAYQMNTLDLLGTKQTVASLAATGNGTNQIISSSGTAAPNPRINFGASTATGLLTVNYSGSTTDTFTGLLGDSVLPRGANNFGLILSGTGTVALTRANVYSGGTTVASGALLLQNGSSGSSTGSGPLSVAFGATIGGVGTSKSSSFTINGSVLVGNGTDVTSQTTLIGTTSSSLAGANLTFNLGTGANQGQSNLLNLGVTPISFANTMLIFNLLGAGVIQPDTSYTLLSMNGPINAAADGLTLGANNQIIGGLSIAETSLFGTSVNGYTSGFYGGSYLYISGDNINVEIVPEPTTWTLVLGGLGVLLASQMRRARVISITRGAKTAGSVPPRPPLELSDRGDGGSVNCRGAALTCGGFA